MKKWVLILISFFSLYAFIPIIDSPHWYLSFIYMLEMWSDLTLFQKIAGPGSLIFGVVCWYMGVESTLKEAKKG